MARRNGVPMLTDEDVLRVARIRTTESSAGTFTQTELDTQLSVERGVIWQINFVEFHIDGRPLRVVGANSQYTIAAQVTRSSQTAMLAANSSEIIQQASKGIARSAAIGTDAGPLSFIDTIPQRFDFPIPLPYASQSIYLGIQGNAAIAIATIDVRIGYLIKRVSDEFFFRVAQALVG